MYLFLDEISSKGEKGTHKLKSSIIMTTFYSYKFILVTSVLISFFAFNAILFY